MIFADTTHLNALCNTVDSSKGEKKEEKKVLKAGRRWNGCVIRAAQREGDRRSETEREDAPKKRDD